MRPIFPLAAVAATLLALPASIHAQTQPQRAQSAQGQATTNPDSRGTARAVTDAEFVRNAAISDMYEIQSSRLAADRSSNAEVKRYAEHMIRDHGKTTNELQSMVQQMGSANSIPLPQQLDPQHQRLLQALQNARGAEFDRLYLQQQTSAHRQAVEMFSGYARSGSNTQLRQWAATTLPTLQEHARDLQQVAAGSSSGMTPGSAGGGAGHGAATGGATNAPGTMPQNQGGSRGTR